MHDEIRHLIDDSYGLRIVNISDAPRQFVAETYLIEVANRTKLFCKIIRKPLFIPQVVESLPVLKALYDCGLKSISYPITTRNNKLMVKHNNALIILFNYIDAPQSYDYDTFAFGRLIATVHNTKLPHTPITKEEYVFKYKDSFLEKLNALVQTDSDDEILKSFKLLLKKYVQEIVSDYDRFLKLSQRLQMQSYEMVITHGDPGGNTLVKTKTDLYLIDWDDILFSPPERDTWFFHDDPEFLKGYSSIFPDYRFNREIGKFYVLKRYFEDLVEYFAEIDSEYDDSHRMKNLKAIEEDCFEGWLRPAIRKFDD